MNKLFVVRKYVLASSAQDTIKKERKQTPDVCLVHLVEQLPCKQLSGRSQVGSLDDMV